MRLLFACGVAWVVGVAACQADVFVAADGAAGDGGPSDAAADVPAAIACGASDGGGPSTLGFDVTMTSLVNMADQNPEGTLEAFAFVATKDDIACAAHLLVGPGNQSDTALIGVYEDQGGALPLVAEATLDGLPKNTTDSGWHAAPLDKPMVVKKGVTYWLALLSPTGSGTLTFRDHNPTSGGGSPSVAHAGAGSTLPDPLSPSGGLSGVYGPVEAYLSR